MGGEIKAELVEVVDRGGSGSLSVEEIKTVNFEAVDACYTKL